jgi:hypothetical protein
MSAKDIVIAAAGGGQTTTPIQFVGGKTVSITPSTSSNTTISLTNLTGSPNTALLPGDIVIVSYVIGATTDAGNPNVTSNTYTVISTLESVDSSSTNFYSSYKIMGATPDTSVTVTPTSSTSRSGVVAIQAYRYVDEVFPIQQPANTATFTSTVRPTPPTITPWSANSVAVIIGAGAHTRGNVSYTSTGLTSFTTSGSTDDTTDSSIGMGFRVITSGSYSPNRFGFPQSDSSTFSSVALSVALKQKPDTVVPSFISYRAVGITSGNTVTLTKPTDVQENDFLLLTISCQTYTQTIVSVPSGFTFVRSDGNVDDSITYTYKKIATASEPASYSIVQSSSSSDISCVISVFRNATTLNTLGAATSSDVSSATAAGITPTVGGLNLAIWMSDGTSGLTTPPAGMTELVVFGGSGSACAQFIYAVSAAPYFTTRSRTLVVDTSTRYVTRFQLQLTDE